MVTINKIETVENEKKTFGIQLKDESNKTAVMVKTRTEKEANNIFCTLIEKSDVQEGNIIYR